MIKKIIILRGIPGSGKSFWAYQKWVTEGLIGNVCVICCADDFFVDKQGVYIFDSSKLGSAHNRCLRKFAKCLVQNQENEGLLIVSNTNTTTQEMLPYVKLAQAFEVPFEVITINCDPALAAVRNSHGVPTHKVYEMDKRLKSASIPKDWNHTVIQAAL
jgi:predicted kinase